MEMQFSEQQEAISGPHLVVYGNRRIIRGIAIGWTIAAAFGLFPLPVLMVAMGFSTLLHTIIIGSLILAELSYILNAWLALRRSTSDEPTLIANRQGLLLYEGSWKIRAVLPWSNIEKLETKRHKTLIIRLRERPSRELGCRWLNGRRYVFTEESLDRPAEELLWQLCKAYERELREHNVQFQ